MQQELRCCNEIRSPSQPYQAAKDNIGNAISYSQTQDSFLEKIGNALDRMSELAMLAQDETKTDADRSLYDKEFQA